MKIKIDLVKTGTVVKDVASVFVLVATSNINVYALNVSLHSGRVSINVNIRKNHSMNKCRRDVVVKRNSKPYQDWMIWTLKPLRRSKVLVKFGTSSQPTRLLLFGNDCRTHPVSRFYCSKLCVFCQFDVFNIDSN